MEDEDLLRRPAPHRPYLPTSAVLTLCPAALAATHSLLQRAGLNESCVFWYGERLGDKALVHSVRSPVQTSRRGNYHVETWAMSQMVHDLPSSWRPLAQIHSHPGHNTEHSRYDDGMTSSRKVLSIVFPFYGRQTTASGVWPAGLGVHEWQDDYWHMLSDSQARARLQIGATYQVDVKDFR